MKRFTIALSVVAFSGAIAAMPQVRDLGVSAVPTGTAVVRGVLTEAANVPVRRAIVTIDGSVPKRSEVTDDEGRFAFTRLPAGRYSLTASKAAYRPAAYGATRPGRPGTPIAVADCETKNIAMSIARGGVISGTIHDEHGAPVVGVLVRAFDALVLASGVANGSAGATTDDRGAFRIYELMPGSYVLVAGQRGGSQPATQRRSSDDVDAILASLRQRGNGEGHIAVSNASDSQPIVTPTAPAYGIAPIFYPGTARYADAVPIAIEAGEEHAGADFMASSVRSVAIEGAVQGAANGAAVELQLDGPLRAAGLMGQPILSQPPDAQGHFKYTNVTPGDYVIRARISASRAMAANGGDSSSGAAPRNAGDRPTDWLYGVTNVTTVDTDVSGVGITLQPGSMLSGRIVVDGAGTISPEKLTAVRIALYSEAGGGTQFAANGTEIGNSFGGQTGAGAPDGTFVVLGIPPGAQRVQMGVAAAIIGTQWRVRSLMAGGVDVLDVPLEVRAGVNVSDAVITLTDKHAELTGVLQTGAGQPATEYYVVVFAADHQMWGARSRRVKAIRPDTNGTFSIKDLPQGDYLVAALTDVAPNEWNDPAFLAKLVKDAIPVTIKDGEVTKQDLRIGG